MKHVALLLLVVACNTPAKEDYTKEAPPEESQAAKPTPPPPKKKMLTEAELGNCHLTASGAVTADQTTPGGRAATNVSYWYKPEEQKSMMGVDGFVVNCVGPDIKFQLVPGGGKADGMPFHPKKYDFDKGKGDANVMIVFGKASVTAPSGSVDVTAFDKRHIAGTVDLSGKLSPGGGDVKLTGQFDLVCPGLSACEL